MPGVQSFGSRYNNWRMRKALLFFGIALLSCGCSAQTIPSSQFQALYESHQWFALREATEHTNAPLFYRAAVEAAFNEIKPSQKDLNSVIRAAPHSSNAYEARSLLAGIYFRMGRYRAALAQTNAMLAEKPDAEDAKNVLPLFSALSQFPDQSVVHAHRSLLHGFLNNGNLVLPLTINGKSANYIVDDGFSTSGMSESEAKRLGLEVRAINTKIDSMSGSQINVRIAVAGDLSIGKLQLANVAFYVLPDQQPPFNKLPSGQRGILGLPVLLAMQTLSWNPRESVAEFAFPPAPLNSAKANLAFEGSSTFVLISFQGKPLSFNLDTGAEHTDLYPAFAKAFPDVVASGKKESHTLTGVGGSANFDSVVLPSLTFHVGGSDVNLRPAYAMLKEKDSGSSWFTGNLGMDLLNQAHTVTLDFHSMLLTLR